MIVGRRTPANRACSTRSRARRARSSPTSRDDARPAHRGRRHRRDCGHARRHRGPARGRGRRGRGGRDRARAAAGAGRRPGDRRARCVDVRSRQMTTSCSRPRSRAAALSSRTSPICAAPGIRGAWPRRCCRCRRATGAGLDRLRAAMVARAVGRRAPARHARRSRTCGTSRCCRARARRARVAPRPRRRRERRRNSCRRSAGGARRVSKRSRARGRRTMCCTRSSRGSVSGSSLQCKVNHARQLRQTSGFRRHRHRRGPRRRRGGVGGGAPRPHASAICTLSDDTVAHMPCNPAIGGTAKGHLVREIDALGGLMGRAIDATGIQFKLLNRSRGPAVWSPRAQADKRRLRRVGARRRSTREPNIEWMIGRAGRILVEHGRVAGLALEDGERVRLPRARRHDRHVSERADPHRPRAAPGRPRGRAAVARARGVAEVVRLRVGPAEDRHAAAARSREHRLRPRVSTRSRARRRSAGAVFVPHRRDRSAADRLSPAPHERSRSRSRAREHRPVAAVQRADPRHRPALLPVARRQDHAVSRQGAAPDLSRAGGPRRATRSTSTASR